MGSTPTAAASPNEDTAKTPKPSGSNKAADTTGTTSPTVSKKATSKKKPATRKDVKKKAATKKTATKKTATRKKSATRKAAKKKAATKKTASSKTAGSKVASAGNTTSPARKRSGLAGFAAPTDTGAEGVASATPPAHEATGNARGDPRSLSWMAASAVNALNAVKAHQAEKALQVKGGSAAGKSGLAGGPEDVPVTDAVTTTTEAPGTVADTGEQPATEGPEVVEIPPLAEDLLASATAEVADESTVADTMHVPVAAAEPQAPTTDAQPVTTSLTGASAESHQGESPQEQAVADVPEEPVQADAPEEIPPALDEPGEAVAADRQEVSPVAAPPDEIATNEAANVPRADNAEDAEPRKPPASPASSAPPPPPAARQGLPVRMIVVAVALGLAVLLGYRFMGSDDEVPDPVVNLPADGSPIPDFSRPAISVVPVVAGSSVPETADAAVVTPADDSTGAAGTEEPPAAVVVTEPVSTGAVMQGDAPADADVAAVTAAAGDKSLAPVALEQAPVTGAVQATAPADAAPADAASSEPEPAPQPASPSPAPLTRQPAYRAPGYGYGYYPPGWQQPGYRQPAWQAPAPR